MRYPVLGVTNVTKRYPVGKRLNEMIMHPFGDRRFVDALNQVTFTVNENEILGIVGPNGAGKTTLLRMLADLLEPDSGHIRLSGRPFKELGSHVRGRIGYASSDERSFYWRISGRHNLEFFARLYNKDTGNIETKATYWLECFALSKRANDPFYTYSSGTKKKFTLIRALLHEPQLVLLDELTNSLDPGSSALAKKMVRDYVTGARGRVGLWSSHRLEEIREICDRVLVINEGQIDYLGPVSECDFSTISQDGGEKSC